MSEHLDHYRQQIIDDFKSFAEEFKAETDRAAVILGAAKLDILLYQLLQNTLIPNTSSHDELLDGDSPLSTFSARIHMAFRLGLIDSEFARALHLVKRIRNAFAHEHYKSTLNSGVHKDRIDELVRPLKTNEVFQVMSKSFYKEILDSATLFRSAVAFICIRLMGALERSKRFSNKNAVNLLIKVSDASDAT